MLNLLFYFQVLSFLEKKILGSQINYMMKNDKINLDLVM